MNGSSCSSCGYVAFPATVVCPRCLSDVGPYAMSTGGTLYAFTEVHVGPSARRPPYVLGYVDLDDGIRILARGAEPIAALSLGARVRVHRGPVSWDETGTAAESYVFSTQGAD